MKSFASFSIGLICLSLVPHFSPPVANAELFDSFFDRFRCDDPYEFVEEYPDYDFDCVDASIPPWPICLFHNVTYFIDAAVSSASRCCDFDDLEECRCPKKYHPKFMEAMEKWCPKIDKCPKVEEGDIKTDLESESPMAWTFMDSMDSMDSMKEDAQLDGEEPEPEPEYYDGEDYPAGPEEDYYGY